MAIKSFNTLIKLHKRRVDVLRREMRALEEERNQLLALSASLQQEFAREMELSAADAKLSGFFGAYSQRVCKKQESIAQEVARITAAIEAKTESIRTEFAEQKKYEIARTNAMRKLTEKANQRQQAIFDEIGSQQYLKLQENPL